ncbi:MAG: hypothetical protein A2233_01145 [Candidatus Kerfeldbacteria bacterium RIFOXYA2_FULL_38_24]|uniref:DUF1704 domain-containing protein n=1 Tax=Candidatus Kerfeldbacteria bacterium RIFOXYB2_FULL_38_14 TaxID=1798547 RepID=A0A1G2BBF2_9BACT|nr:MAG: hypothetical protein A2233_01145 [Candidatus Kerfeldbacteria bacterium RIFOXYA2_FULL_38_24]OGY86543.1 MAG: hypothetical protein A2319_02135 [Candidatus Kerfeldbacteria bacterium RIFOXYB2_FULL_38_14]OGY89055.1 MAG: hypothetical protein A2458_01025 [Candidatus Kerfeldbacteria bacterium RIFOXYC2_FULL_38_9]
MNKKKLDINWFSRLEKFNKYGVVLCFDAEFKQFEKQKKLFFQNKIKNPSFNYYKLSDVSIREVVMALEKLWKDIQKKEKNQIVREAYWGCIKHNITVANLLHQAFLKKMDSYLYYSIKAFGAPDINIFYQDLIFIRNSITTGKKSSKKERVLVAKKLENSLEKMLKLIKNKKNKNVYKKEVKDKILENIYQKTQGEFQQLLQEERIYEAQEIKKVLILALKKFGIKGWGVIINKGASDNINVNHEKKIIVIPHNRCVDASYLYVVIIHEVLTHILRFCNGLQSPLLLLSSGLAGYLKAEEGLAVMREHCIMGEHNNSKLIALHFAICLAIGLDGTKRNFREVFEIMKNYHYFDYLVNIKMSHEVALEKSQERAWQNCVRIFRGTDCSTRGVVLTKDLAYREGSVHMWNFLQKNPQEIHRLDAGKYNPMDKSHRYILDQLGIK